MTTERPLTLPIKAAFTYGQVAGQVFRDIPSILLLFYLTSVIGLEPAVAGAAIFVPKVFFGVLADISVGLLSDHFSRRFPRRFWLLIGAVLGPIALILIFRVPDGSTGLRIAYVFATMSLYMLAFASVSVPYLAQYSEITENRHERMVLMAWRHGFTGLGVLVGSALTPVVIHRLGGDRAAYGITSCLLAVICISSLVIAYVAASKIPSRLKAAGAPVSLKGLLGVFRYAPFTILLAVFFAQEIGAGMSSAAIAFFLTYNMELPDALAKLGIISLLAGFVVILASPFWIAMSRRFGKKRSYMWAALGHAAIQLAWGFFSSSTPIGFTYVLSAALGLANSGWGIMVLAMLGDMIADSARESGADRGGSFSAVWSLTEKIGLASGGTLISGLLLSAFGFSSAVAARHGVQSESALRGIAMTFAFAPCALNLGAVLVFWRFGQAQEARPAEIDPTLPEASPL